MKDPPVSERVDGQCKVRQGAISRHFDSFTITSQFRNSLVEASKCGRNACNSSRVLPLVTRFLNGFGAVLSLSSAKMRASGGRKEKWAQQEEADGEERTETASVKE